MGDDFAKDIVLHLIGYVTIDDTTLERKAVLAVEKYDNQYFLKEGEDFFLLHRKSENTFLKVKLTSEKEIIDEEFIEHSQYKNAYERLKPKLLKYKLEKLLS